MSIADELRERQQRDGIIPTKFYICGQCDAIHELPEQYVDRCASCEWEGELTVSSSREAAEAVVSEHRQPGYNRFLGRMNTPEPDPHEEQLRGFILDPSQVQERVPFAMFHSKDTLGVGLFLPRWYDIRGKGDAVLGQEQRDVPVIVTDGHQLLQPRHNQIEALQIRLEAVPGEMRLRWSLPCIQAHLTGSAPQINPRNVYEAIRAEYEKVLYFNPSTWYTTHAVWDVGTYFCQLFNSFPYVELRGVRASAKSKIMQLSSCVSFNSTGLLASPTEATLFRTTHDQRPTTYLDEAENLFRIVKGQVEHDGRVEVINSGYSKGGAVPRMESIGKRWVQVVYHTYSPKMIGSIAGLHGATESRAILHVTVRAPDHDKRGEMDVDPASPRWQELRDQLYLLLMQHWRTVLQNYQDLQRESSTKLKRREWQLWRPLLAVARLFGKDVERELLQHAEKLASVRNEDLQEGTFDFILLSRVNDLLGQGPVVLLKDIAAAPEWMERKPHSKTLKRKIDAYGFAETYEHTREGWGYRIQREHFDAIVSTIASSIISVTPSPPSQIHNFTDDNKEKIEVTLRDRNAETVTEVRDGNDANDGSDANQNRTPEIRTLQDIPGVVRKLGRGQPVPIADILARWSGMPEQLQVALAALRARGDLTAPRPDYVGVPDG